MKRITLLLSLGVVLAACGGGGDGGSNDDGDAASEPTKVTIKTVEYGFTVPDSFKGGLVELTLDNTDGKESHEAEMLRLDEGKTQADVLAAVTSGEEQPDWAHTAGGPGPVLPGATAVYTANVAAGIYVFLCHVPAPDGKEHAEKGMIAEVQVEEGADGTLPEGDVTVTLDEYTFGGLDGLEVGSQAVRVVNEGQQEHHIAIIALADGKTLADLTAFFSEGSGPPPFTGFPGLVASLPAGDEAVRTLELDAGTYAFACFVPAPDKTPHFFMGMSDEITLS